MTGMVYSQFGVCFGSICFLYATSHVAVALTSIVYCRYRHFAAEVTALLILGSVWPHVSFSALVVKSENEPQTDKPIKQISPLSPITIHVGLLLRPFYNILL